MMHAPHAHVLTPDLLRADTPPARVGRRIIVLPEIDSTNTHALDVVAPRDGLPADGTVIFAERQTAGRGRLGRTWHSPAGASLMFTTLLHEPEHVSRAAFWMMAAAMAVLRGIESTTDVSPQIRWPNDIYVNHRKLAGILVEARVTAIQPPTAAHPSRGWLAIGIGLNCLQHTAHFPPDIRDTCTSLEMESGAPIDRPAVARSILRELDRFFAAPAKIADDQLAADWIARSGDIGQRVTLTSGREQFTGCILDVQPQTGLLLQLDTGARRWFDPATTSRA